MKFPTVRRLVAATLVAAAFAPALAQSLPPAQTFPNEIKGAVNKHLNLARQLAGDDLYPYFAQRCIFDQAFPILDDLAQEAGLVTPTKAFDGLYFVGQNAASAWVSKTNKGLVLFDALYDAAQAETIVEAGLRELGLDPADLKYLVVTHEHGDHYGGAKYFQDKYGTQVLASDPAWNSMASNPLAPVRNITIADGQAFPVGNKTFKFYITPGHTPGALSTLIPVADKGTPHMAALYGGYGIPRLPETKLQQIESLKRFGAEAVTAGVDVIIGNHQVQDQSLYKFDLLRHRRCAAGVCIDPNPFVLTDKTAYKRFNAMQQQCVRVKAARDGQILSGL